MSTPRKKPVRWKDPLPVVLVRRRAPLTLDKLTAILRGWEPGDPRRQALEDVMDMVMSEILPDVGRREAKSRERHWSAGALEGLRYLDAKLRELASTPETPEKPRR
jgi:hypothetical protein